jgi:hypothetical protein
MAQPTNFLGINSGTDAKRAAITQPGGISYVLAYITDTARLWFFDGTTVGGIELALASDLKDVVSPVFPAQTANFSASAGRLYHVDTTGGAITATLPASPNAGDTVGFVDSSLAGAFASHSLTIALNGQKYQNATTNLAMSIGYGMLKIQFNGTQWVQVP